MKNNIKSNKKIYNLVLSAMFLGIGIVLPFFTGQIPSVGKMLLPMHIPVLLCGLVCGPEYGLIVGFVLPLVRSLWFGMPVLYPTAVGISFEMATYGFVAGFLYFKSKYKCIWALYKALIPAMITGRVVWGAVSAILIGISGSSFTFKAFLAGAFLNCIPGIVLQLILVPAVMIMLKRTKLVK